MTEPISGVAATPPVQTARPVLEVPAPSTITLEVSRAQEAPIYVYRVMDNDTGRTLVEIPQRSSDAVKDVPGRHLDTTA